MNFLNDIYYKSVADNNKNIQFWENYLQNLKSLDFNIFSEKLKVPTLVPVGSRILFRGELKHTNEVTVALGANYFVKCSIKQAEELRQHRIKDAISKIDTFRKEREYLESQIYGKKNVYENQGHEIVETYNEEEEKAWRVKHKENMRLQKQRKNMDVESKEEITDEELWNRLEELELQEELENEMSNMKTEDENPVDEDSSQNFFIKDEDKDVFVKQKEEKVIESVNSDTKQRKVTFTETTPKQTSKLDLLQQVLEKQSELEEKLLELKHKERDRSKTENDILSRLDEMEELDELEDEMDRLDDILENEDIDEDVEENDTTSTSPGTKLKRSVSFADEDDSETIEITFKHSDIEPSKEPYVSEKGITKPSDIYEAYPSSFNSETTSILKKKKYECDVPDKIYLPKSVKFNKCPDPITDRDSNEAARPRAIIVKDIVENVDYKDNKFDDTEKRPTSLFKMRRQQKKS